MLSWPMMRPWVKVGWKKRGNPLDIVGKIVGEEKSRPALRGTDYYVRRYQLRPACHVLMGIAYVTR